MPHGRTLRKWDQANSCKHASMEVDPLCALFVRTNFAMRSQGGLAVAWRLEFVKFLPDSRRGREIYLPNVSERLSFFMVQDAFD